MDHFGPRFNFYQLLWHKTPIQRVQPIYLLETTIDFFVNRTKMKYSKVFCNVFAAHDFSTSSMMDDAGTSSKIVFVVKCS